MPAFYLCAILMIAFIWFCCAQLYEPIGKYIRDWIYEVKDVLTKDENEFEEEN